MGTVTSIRKTPYNLPVYTDCRGEKVSIRVLIDESEEENKWKTVTGEKTVHGLILHRSIGGNQTNQKWALTEPGTGRRVVTGHTRQDALDGIAELVAYYGGAEEFRKVMKLAVDQYQKGGEQTQ